MTSREPTSPPRKTHLAQALFLIAGGIIAAAQIGKIIVAMPLIQAEMRLGLGEVSLLIAVFATLGSLFGLGAGVMARRIGARRCLVGGMLTIATASAAGAFAHGAGLLLASRIAEGMGFLAIVVVVPDLLNACGGGERPRLHVRTLGLLHADRHCFDAAHRPAAAAVRLAPPLARRRGRRRALCFRRGIVLRRPPVEKPAGDDLRSFLRESASVLREPACILLAAAFGLYTFQYFTIAGFLPVLLVSALHLDLAAASLFTTLAVIANACRQYRRRRSAAGRRAALVQYARGARGLCFCRTVDLQRRSAAVRRRRHRRVWHWGRAGSCPARSSPQSRFLPRGAVSSRRPSG